MDTDNPWTKSETFAWNEGRRIVDLFELSKQLLCKRCEALLDLRRIEREDRFGFASVLYVPCVCGVTNELHTSRKQEPSSPSNPMYEVNIKASINLLLYGTGASNILGFLAVLDIPVPPPDDSCLIVPVTSDPGTSCTVTTSMSSSGASVASLSLPVSFDIQRQMSSAGVVSMDTIHSYHLEHSLHFLHQEADDKADEEEMKHSVKTDIVRKDGVKQQKGQPQEVTRGKGQPQEVIPKTAEGSDYEEFVNPMEWSSDSDVPEKADSDSSWKAEDEFEEKVLKKRAVRPRPVFTRKQRKSNPSVEPSEATTLKLRCEECSKDFPTLRGYNIHMKRVHSQESEARVYAGSPTQISAKQSSQGSSSEDHEEGTSNEEKELMEESDDEFDSNSILPSSDDDVKEKRFPCGLCSKAFTTKRQFTDHVKVHARHPCSLCPFTGSTVRSVGLHELEAHNGKIQHKCPECGKTFRALHYIRSHISKIHRRQSRHLAKTCEVCGKVVSSHFSLINHRRTHTGEKPYNCDQCWRSFAAERNLRCHMLVHSDRRKRFQCRFCPMEVLSQASLKRHEKIHQNLLDTYPCKFCGKNFNNKYNLKVHLRIHTGEKPYVCNICGVGFPQKNSIDVHMKKHKIIVKSDDLDAEIGLRGQPRFSTM